MIMKSSTIQRNFKKVNYRRIKNIHKFVVRKRILMSRPDEIDTLIKNYRRSTLTNHQLKNVVRVIYLLMELLINLLNSPMSLINFKIIKQFLFAQFEIIPSGADGNCLCHTLNNIVYWRIIDNKKHKRWNMWFSTQEENI